jgi:hypothetical protein
MRLLLEDEPLVELRLEDAPRDRDTKLERHVEAWRPWHGAGELHAAEVVDRVAALLHQANDPIQATAGTGDLKCCARKKAKRTQSRDVREIQSDEAFVVGNVEKNGLRRRLTWNGRGSRPRLLPAASGSALPALFRA